MLVLQQEFYEDFREYLEKFFPQSLPVYHLVNGICNNEFPWENIEFVVDQWPNPRVVVCRPVAEQDFSGEKIYFCRQVCRYTVTIWSSNTTVLQEMLKDPDLLDWDQEIMFHGLSCPDVLHAVEKFCDGKGTIYGAEPDWCCEVYELRAETLPRCSVTLPTGCYLSTLNQSHAEQINHEWDYGGTLATKEFLLKALDNKQKAFPSAAIMNDTGKAVSYILYEPEGNMAIGYTNPEYRNKGFFRVVNYILAQKLFNMGRKSTYVQINAENHASKKVYTRLGAKLIPGWKQHWLLFIPRSSPISSVTFNYQKSAVHI